MEKKYERKKVLLASLIIFIFIMSLVIGIVVGLNQTTIPATNNQDSKLVAETKDKKTSKNEQKTKEDYIKEKKEEIISNKTETGENQTEDSKIEKENYSDEYKEYLEKTEEEKNELDVIPRKMMSKKKN